jgi:octaprenyl-diphosphate synthase
MTIKDIFTPVEPNLKEFNSVFKELMKSNVPLLDLIITYMTSKKGKQVRPSVILLVAGMVGQINKRTYIGASMIEILHNATLIHDDVVDEAFTRRGLATINSKWNNKIAVLIGDFLLSKGLLAAMDNNEVGFLNATSTATRRMSEGELLQIQKSKEFNMDEETYFKIISEKTAALFNASCEIGGLSANATAEQVENLKNYGEYVGLAFQIKDDILDYDSKSIIIGKPVGNDLKEKKITLPLIYSLKQIPKKDAKEMIKILKNKKLNKKHIGNIISFVKEQKGTEYAAEVAYSFSQKAIDCLADFKDSEYKQSLINFAKFVVERDN